MNKVKQFMNKITEKAQPDPSSGVMPQSFGDSEGQVSAEGFLCPDCMTAFPSPEALAEHYSTKHGAAAANDSSSMDADPDTDLDSALTQQELHELRIALTNEREHSSELQREISFLKNELETRKSSMSSTPENDHEGASERERRKEEQFAQLIEQIKKLSRDLRERTAEVEESKVEINRLEALVGTRAREQTETENELRQECVTLREETDKMRTMGQKEAEKCQEEVEHSKKRADEAIEQVNTVTNMLKLEQQSHLDNVNLHKEKLSMVENQSKITEAECDQLRQEAQRLRDQHAELVGRVEGDEAAEAVIGSLTKERDSLKDNLETTQGHNRELLKNLHNILLELEKSKEEYKTLTKEYVEMRATLEVEAKLVESQQEEKDKLTLTVHEQLKDCITDYKLELDDRIAECLRLGEVSKSLESEVGVLRGTLTMHLQEVRDTRAESLSLTEELRMANERAEAAEALNVTLKKDLELSTDKVQKLEAELEATESGNRKLEGEVEFQKKAKREIESKLVEAEEALTTLTGEFEKCRVDFAASVTTYEDLVACTNAIKLEVEGKLGDMSKKLAEAKVDLDKAKTEYAELAEDYEHYKDAQALEFHVLKKELEEAKILADEQSTAAKTLTEEMNGVKEEVVGLKEAASRFQDERDTVQAEKLELDRKLKSSEEARSLLLDRCLVGESAAEKSQETIQGLQRKLADALAALQELGRENQSLQVESAKLQGRKWADDSIVTNCFTCTKEFSLTIRKHHCRVCGNIFCHECSARTASIPSSKKPVRVCDACCEELSTK